MSVAYDAPFDALKSALSTIEMEQCGLQQLSDALRNDLATPFRHAIHRIHRATGRVIVTGMGKSGHVGKKIAATLSSTGTAAYFVHPSEASHGDLGQIQTDDVILALSWSGNTAELSAILTYAKRFSITLIAITSNADSELGRAADIGLILPRSQEACPNGLAPTTSTTMQLVLGDALAVSLIEARGFSAQDFKIFHPGGRLGAQLRYVRDVMQSGDGLPLVRIGTRMAEALLEMSSKGCGCVLVENADKTIAGIITDGDLRRHMATDLTTRLVEEVMTDNPYVVTPDTLAGEAVHLVENTKVSTLIVAQENKIPLGIVHILDLLRAGTA